MLAGLYVYFGQCLGPSLNFRPEFGPLSMYDDSCPHIFVDKSIGPNQYSSAGAQEQKLMGLKAYTDCGFGSIGPLCY